MPFENGIVAMMVPSTALKRYSEPRRASRSYGLEERRVQLTATVQPSGELRLEVVPLNKLLEIRCGHGRHLHSFRITALHVVVPG
jgi:hypothetical protein